MTLRVSQLIVNSASLAVPAAELSQLARDVGCRLTHHTSLAVLHDPGKGALVFQVEGADAVLVQLGATDLGFLRRVVGPVFSAYGGDLEATVAWTTTEPPVHLVIREGEAGHPLFGPADPVTAASLAMVEQWLADARDAWREYQDLRSSAEL